MAPHNKTYVLPRKLATRPPSPSAGYNSDPESSSRKIRHVGDIFPLPSADANSGVLDNTNTRPSHRRHGIGTRRNEDGPYTAGWTDILKYVGAHQHYDTSAELYHYRLVTLQTCIVDTEQSLEEIVTAVDKILEEDVNSVLVCFIFYKS